MKYLLLTIRIYIAFRQNTGTVNSPINTKETKFQQLCHVRSHKFTDCCSSKAILATINNSSHFILSLTEMTYEQFRKFEHWTIIMNVFDNA